MLRLDKFQRLQGLPTGLLKAVAGMTSLRVLNMAGCSPEARPPAPALPAPQPIASQLEASASDEMELSQPAPPSAAAPSSAAAASCSAAVAATLGLSPAEAAAHASAHAPSPSSQSHLWFLKGLKGLRDLDLSSWRHVSPSSLQGISGLTQLTRLAIQR